MEFIQIGQNYINTAEIHGFDVDEAGAVTLHYGNAARKLSLEESKTVLDWAKGSMAKGQTSTPHPHTTSKK